MISCGCREVGKTHFQKWLADDGADSVNIGGKERGTDDNIMCPIFTFRSKLKCSSLVDHMNREPCRVIGCI